MHIHRCVVFLYDISSIYSFYVKYKKRKIHAQKWAFLLNFLPYNRIIEKNYNYVKNMHTYLFNNFF